MKEINALIKKIFTKLFTKEVIFYGLFGVLTTIVNIGSFYVFNSIFSIEENISNAIAVFIAVLFAYFTNRKLVFNSKASNLKEKLLEFLKFIAGRAFTMLVELVGFWLLATLLGIHELVSKLTITILVIILNFFISKFFAFKNK